MLTENNITRTVITAPPGWYVAFFNEGGEDATTGKKWGDSFSFEPILAWEITREAGRDGPNDWFRHDVMPLTLNGSVESTFYCILIIKTPDGTFDFVTDRTCDTEADALVHARELHDREQDQRAKAKAAAGQAA